MPDEMEEVKARVRRMRSIQVLNQEVGNLRQDVKQVHSKLDEFLLVAASMAGSIKLGVRALCIIASVFSVALVLALFGRHSPIVELLLSMWKAVGH